MKIAKELLAIAKLITAKTYGHTLWIDSKGKVIDMVTGILTGYKKMLMI